MKRILAAAGFCATCLALGLAPDAASAQEALRPPNVICSVVNFRFCDQGAPREVAAPPDLAPEPLPAEPAKPVTAPRRQGKAHKAKSQKMPHPHTKASSAGTGIN